MLQRPLPLVEQMRTDGASLGHEALDSDTLVTVPSQAQPIPALTSKAESALRVLVRWPLSFGGGGNALTWLS